MEREWDAHGTATGCQGRLLGWRKGWGLPFFCGPWHEQDVEFREFLRHDRASECDRMKR